MRNTHAFLLLPLLITPLLADDVGTRPPTPGAPAAVTVAPSSPAPDPAPADADWVEVTPADSAPSIPTYFLRFWAENPDKVVSFELGYAAMLGQRANVHEGLILGVLLPNTEKSMPVGAENAALEKAKVGMTVQEVSLGQQISFEMSQATDRRFTLDLTWSWDEPKSRTTFWIDRETHSITTLISGDLGRPILLRKIRVGETKLDLYVEVTPH